MTWVKICGITNQEDASAAVEAGANALGFVFYDKSPRKIDAQTAREIVAKMPLDIEKVGVFVNQSVETILKTVADAGLTAAQLHGGASFEPEVLQKIGRDLKIFLVRSATGIGGDFNWHELRKSGVAAVFLDSGTPQMPGGTGKVFDWKAAAGAIRAMGEELNVNVVVAGGLNSNNVADALRIMKPWGVDVASGVEARPGKKDPEKVRSFIDAVRRAER